ncbi:MAG TPA: hypothetical protein VFM18_08255, partial [Methanosarcina sp.]|nr:hypothetical protein [Methanosarcina sp.]
MTWLYNGVEFNEIPSGSKPEGFVYRITNLIDGRMYLGKKSFFSTKTVTVKGKKKKTKVESDWKKY